MRQGRIGSTIRGLYAEPGSAIGISFTLLFLAVALFGPFIAPYGPNAMNASATLKAPSPAHPFGTDDLGRDVLSRVIYGASDVLLTAAGGTLPPVAIGTFLGLFAAYRGGLLDELLMRMFDGLLAVPALLLALLALGLSGSSTLGIEGVLLVAYTPIVTRVVRSAALSVRNKEFVESARLYGEAPLRILFREMFPSVLPTLSVETALRFSYSIFLVASLGFLGIGVQPPSPSWGLMIREGEEFVNTAPWAMYFPAGAISLVVIGVNLAAGGLARVLQAPEATPERIGQR